MATRALRARAASLSRWPGRGGGWVVVQVILIAAIVLSPLAGHEWHGALAPVAWVAGGLFVALGAALLVAGGVGLGSALTPFPTPLPGAELQTSGIYGRVRHPMYGGGILIGLGWSTIFATPLGLALSAVLAAFADLKARREERWLEQKHPGYTEYRARTPHRLIPFIW